MDVREVLDGIAERADRMARPDPTGMRIAPDTYITDDDRKAGEFNPIWFIVRDLRGLVAASRAVLDRHKPWDRLPFDGVSARCEACNGVWPCPDYRNVTDALGGGA